MTLLLEFKEKLKEAYAGYSHILLPALKFLFALVVFQTINLNIGYMSILTNIFVVLILALICCLLPLQAVVVISGVMLLGHSYAVSIEAAGLALLLLILLSIFCIRFVGRDAIVMVLTPIAFGIGIPCAIPICCGLKRSPASGVAIGSGVIVYSFIHMLKSRATLLQGGDNSEIFNRVRIMMEGTFQDSDLLLNLLSLILVLIVVYLIRRTGKDYAWHIAIFVGGIIYLAIMICGSIFMDTQSSVIVLVLGTLISCLVALVLEFFVLNVDYSRIERMEFEDEEYYYYVKAVPKISISTPQREIKTISAGARARRPESGRTESRRAEARKAEARRAEARKAEADSLQMNEMADQNVAAAVDAMAQNTNPYASDLGVDSGFASNQVKDDFLDFEIPNTGFASNQVQDEELLDFEIPNTGFASNQVQDEEFLDDDFQVNQYDDVQDTTYRNINDDKVAVDDISRKLEESLRDL